MNANGTLGVDNSMEVDGDFEEAFAYATCGGAHCSVFFPGAPVGGDYRVLSTDYENYSLVYSCT